MHRIQKMGSNKQKIVFSLGEVCMARYPNTRMHALFSVNIVLLIKAESNSRAAKPKFELLNPNSHSAVSITLLKITTLGISVL